MKSYAKSIQFHSRKCIRKCLLRNGGNFVSASMCQTSTGSGNVLVSSRHAPSHYLNQSWWRHQMETFSALLAIYVGNSPVPGEFPPQRPVTRSFDVFFDLPPNKWLSKQSWGWWFETPSRPLWRHGNNDGLCAVCIRLVPVVDMHHQHRSLAH